VRIVIDLGLSDAHERLRSDIRAAALNLLRPLASGPDADGYSSDAVSSALQGIDTLPDLTHTDATAFCLAAESLAWGDPAVAYAWTASRQVAWLLATCGSGDQKDRYLTRLGKAVNTPASLMLFEGFGRAPSELTTTARRDGDDWVIDGEKTAVAFAGQAEVSVVVARAEDGDLIAFVVDSPSVEVTFEGAKDRRIAMSGVQIASTASINGLRVGNEAVLASGSQLERALGVCRLALAAVSLGAAESTTRYAADWSAQRIAFGRTLAGFQGVSFVIADLYMEVESTRVGLGNAVSTLSSSGATHLNGEQIDGLVSPIVGQANHLLRDAAREGVELMGVHGVITDHPAEHIFRAAPLLASIDFDPLNNPLVLR
jgi:alkylation response protein AidB-like acyl-CoA dehydrogenase